MPKTFSRKVRRDVVMVLTPEAHVHSIYQWGMFWNME